jgi:hypothetical protein
MDGTRFMRQVDSPSETKLPHLISLIGVSHATIIRRALSTCYLSTGSTSMKVHDRLGRQSYAAVERRVMSCQVANLFPSS